MHLEDMVVTMVAQPKSGETSSGKARIERGKVEWALLSYRLPRDPSTPRIAVWRRLKKIGVAKIGDGLVGLPNNDRTREHLEWVAIQVIEADGEAVVWAATPTTLADTEQLIDQLQQARTAEYRALLNEIEGAQMNSAKSDSAKSDSAKRPNLDQRTIARWRREWRLIERRDYFEADGKEQARAAIENIAEWSASGGTPTSDAVPRGSSQDHAAGIDA